MTENEAKWEYCRAIDLIKKIKTEETHERYIDRHKAFDMAIQALEEVQQYRAIGTVKGYERAIASSIENYNLYREYKAKVQEYEAIGTVEEFKALKEKNEPKKPIDKIMHLECPACGDVEILDCGYCPVCGQKLDWND